VIWIDRRKCLLFTHATTLFPEFVPDVRAADTRPIGAYAIRVIRSALHAEHLPLDALGVIDPDDVRLAKTVSRSVLGFMNDQAFNCRYQVARMRGLDSSDAAALNHFLRRVLHGRDGYVRPLDLVAERLASHGSPHRSP
jgi:hypothetical protein